MRLPHFRVMTEFERRQRDVYDYGRDAPSCMSCGCKQIDGTKLRCRRYPPLNGWPEVRASDVCGEYVQDHQ